MRNSSLNQPAAGSALRRVAAVAAFALVAALPLRLAHADNDDRRDDRRSQYQHEDRGRRDNQARYRHEPPRYERYRRYPVYAPPPVYYPRYESPGIRLVFPFDIH